MLVVMTEENLTKDLIKARREIGEKKMNRSLLVMKKKVGVATQRH